MWSSTPQQEGYGFSNYRVLVDYDAGLLKYLWYSSVVSALTVVLTLALSVLGGYALPGSGSGGGSSALE